MLKTLPIENVHMIIKWDIHLLDVAWEFERARVPSVWLGFMNKSYKQSRHYCTTNWPFTDWLILKFEYNVCTTAIQPLKTEETEWVLFEYYPEV